VPGSRSDAVGCNKTLELTMKIARTGNWKVGAGQANRWLSANTFRVGCQAAHNTRCRRAMTFVTLTGESGGALSFGIRDSRILSRLLDSRPEVSAPLYVLGDSMGTLAAAHLASMRKDVRGLILQAPTVVFDRTIVSYIKSNSPWLAWCLTERAMRQGAVRALARAGVSLSQTGHKADPRLAIDSGADPCAS
jgi:pimeloyl-ACP methyl ester carboxylesterase